MQGAADATLNFARQGFTAKQATDMLTPAMNLAAGTGTDLSEMTSGLGNAMKMFGADSSEAASYDAIADEIFRLREEKADASARSQKDLQNRITELQVFLKDQQTDIAEFDERMVRKLIRQITIYQDRAVIEFKSGLQITINE